MMLLEFVPEELLLLPKWRTFSVVLPFEPAQCAGKGDLVLASLNKFAAVFEPAKRVKVFKMSMMFEILELAKTRLESKQFRNQLNVTW